jgi:glucoamylase
MLVTKTALASRAMKAGPGHRLGAALLAGAVLVAALLLLSGDERADPRTPPALPGMPSPFLGVAVLGEGELTAAVDAYGNVVDLRRAPAGPALIENPADRQAAGTVAADTGIQPWVQVDDGPELPMWRADRIRQRYLPGTNVLRTEAWFDGARVVVTQAVHGDELAIAVNGGASSVRLRASAGRKFMTKDPRVLAGAAASSRRWLSRSRPLGAAAPAWAEDMYERSLLVLHALTDRRNGAVAAGARDGWAYVWPRDAGAAAIALAAAGYEPEAELIVQFMLGLGVEQFARFNGDGSPVPDRPGQGDEIGWVAAAAEAAGIIGSARHAAKILSETYPVPWRERDDYWESGPGDFLANAIASGESAERIEAEFGMPDGLVREAGGDGGLETAAAWAVRPFPRPALFEPARRTLLQLTADAGRYGLLPGEGWEGGEDPWSAPTAWTAWSLAALGERAQALRLMAALRRGATAAGDLPERVDADTGIPRSTTPLAWSHAFALLALRELWPSR